MNTETHGIAWSDSFKIGNEQIDLQHKTLLELVNELVGACTLGRDTERLQNTLSFLVNYTVKHFAAEEALQVRCRYPGYVRHKQLHEDFRLTVGGLVEKFNRHGSSGELSSDVNKIVVRWLVEHIMREDKKIGAYLKNC